MRKCIGFVVGALAAFGAAVTGLHAQDKYPSRNIEMLVGFAPGTGADISARAFATAMTKQSGGNVVVVNKPGSAGTLSAMTAIASRPDGHTLYYGASANIIAGPLFVKDFGVDPMEGLVPVRGLSEATFVLAVSPQSKASTLTELTSMLKEKGQAKFGHSTNIALVSSHVYANRIDVKAVPVAYRAVTDALPDLDSAALDFYVMDAPFAIAQAKTDKIRILSVISAKRSAALPDVPTMEEMGLEDFDFTPWWGLFVPANTPSEAVDALGGWVDAIQKHLQETGASGPESYVLPGATLWFADGAALKQRMISEREVWGKAVKAAGIEPQ